MQVSLSIGKVQCSKEFGVCERTRPDARPGRSMHPVKQPMEPQMTGIISFEAAVEAEPFRPAVVVLLRSEAREEVLPGIREVAADIPEGLPAAGAHQQ